MLYGWLWAAYDGTPGHPDAIFDNQIFAVLTIGGGLIGAALLITSSRLKPSGIVSRHWRYAAGFLVVMTIFGIGAFYSAERGEDLARIRAEQDVSLAKSFNELRARWGVEEKPVKTLRIAPDGTVKSDRH